MVNLYAACRSNGTLQIKRVSVTQSIQNELAIRFDQQEQAFRDEADEVDFNGEWKADAHELLVIDEPSDASIIKNAVAANPVSLPFIDVSHFEAEGIRSLFTAPEDRGAGRILFQLFSAQQFLSRRFVLLLSGDTFTRLSEPAFSIDTKLVAILEHGKLKFKSFSNIKRVFDLSQFYQEATDQELECFCAHTCLYVTDSSAFKCSADQVIRRLVHTIGQSGVLDEHSVESIRHKAEELGLDIDVKSGRIVMPGERKAIKQLLQFLDNNIYHAVLGEERYLTNSKKPLPPTRGAWTN